MTGTEKQRVLLVCGGVGGAKLAQGFEQLSDQLDVWNLVNVGDDFEHLGLSICPDLDTVLYTLAGIANREQGWGIEGESWRTLERLSALGGESWFRLGDLDLATHLFRSAALSRGDSLTAVTEKLAQRMGVRSRVLPASNQRLRTQVRTDTSVLDFQEYFVRERCEPRVKQILFNGAADARPSPALEAATADGASPFAAVILAPSNPFLSIAPILAIPGMSELLRHASSRVAAVSPIVSGKAIKGPAAKLMAELGLQVSAAGWARYLRDHYGALVDEWILDASDRSDAKELATLGFAVRTTDTIMTGPPQRLAFARWLMAGAL